VYDYLICRNKNNVFLLPVYKRDIMFVVNGCKSKKSTDCDDVEIRLNKSVTTYAV